jgi:hypothetical protein
VDVLYAELDALGTGSPNLQTSLDSFIEHCIDVILPTSSGIVGTNDLTDNAVDFLAADVEPGHCVLIRYDAGVGLHTIVSVAQHDVTIEGTFDSTGISAYRIVKPFEVGVRTLDRLVRAWAEAVDAFNAALDFQSPALGYTVLKSTGMTNFDIYANGLTISRIASRLIEVNTRRDGTGSGTLANLVTAIEQALKTDDRLYDKRFTWINARTNLIDGTLARRARTIADREANRAKLADALIKLLAMG